jgi:hypothetical protein
VAEVASHAAAKRTESPGASSSTVGARTQVVPLPGGVAQVGRHPQRVAGRQGVGGDHGQAHGELGGAAAPRGAAGQERRQQGGRGKAKQSVHSGTVRSRKRGMAARKREPSGRSIM